ncbi:unnamed protein product [Rotaria socialis]|uniref:YTH domain-containing protein n=2 Tax=Rotaria socialis TaxID=392032 RepID=A0A820PIL6_9BILA|nr:unnamed protein product [Rotaria socialis]CAF4403011.1 unnamed protein product [Rotaria socialis]CAF4438053.1 unnamed protein product [Rotaria socialis]CAF4684937.1 unnamed protein product [Rotaria socialis]
MSGGVELDLACGESDADEFSSSSKSKQTRTVSIEEDQVFANGDGVGNGDDDDDDEIAIIEESKAISQNESQISEKSIGNDYPNAMKTNFSDITRNETNYNDFNDETMPNESSCVEIEVSGGKNKPEHESNRNEQRKTNVPTLMITVKNEMAQPIREQTIPTTDSSGTATLRHIFSDAVYFLIKSGNEENISLAKSKGVWSTPPANEQKLNRSFRDHRNVILIFSVAESKAFQGFARMSCEARHDSQPVHWILPPGMSNRAFSGVIYIDWITCRSLPFGKTSHLFNSWNENKPVKIGRDGQEIEPRCAEALCRLFPSDPTIDIIAIATKAKNNKKRCSSRSQSHSPSSINVSSSLPLESLSSSSLVIKRQTSKDRNRRSSSQDTKHRPTSPPLPPPASTDFSSRHSSNRYRHRSPSNHDRPRYQQSRNRERENNDLQRKRRRRSRSSHSDHGGKAGSHRKHNHRNNGDQPPYNNNNKKMSKIIGSGTCDEYMNHLVATHAQYAGYGAPIFPHGTYPMAYDPTTFYPMGYDHRGMPIPMYGAGYEVPMDMYYPQPTSSMPSSRSRNVNEYEQEINAFLRHTTTTGPYPTNDINIKSHRNQRHQRHEDDYRYKSSSRHRSKSREHRR